MAAATVGLAATNVAAVQALTISGTGPPAGGHETAQADFLIKDSTLAALEIWPRRTY